MEHSSQDGCTTGGKAVQAQKNSVAPETADAKRPRLASAAMLTGLAATVGFILACASQPPYTPLPASRWNGTFSYSYNPPQTQRPAPVRINVVVVEPFYREAESALMDNTYAKVGRGFAKSMGVDLDKIIVSKGMTSIGPYQTLDDVTFPAKRGSDITLAPRVFLTTETKFSPPTEREYQGTGHFAKSFTMRIGGWVSYEMREPITGQKLWVKRLDLTERDVQGIEVYDAVAVRTDKYGHVTQWAEGKQVHSGREDALADAIRAYYPEIMEKAWTYLDTDEIQELRKMAQEVRDRKVY
jgi:hypothetical protein